MQLVNKNSSTIIFGIGVIITSTLFGWSSRSVWYLAIIEIVILSVFLIAATQTDDKKFKLPIILKSLIFFLILSSLFSVYYYNSILTLVMYLLFITAFWMIVQFVRSKEQFKLIIFIISTVALVAAINGIVNFFELQDISVGVASFFGWRNVFAGFILLVLPITLTQFLAGKERKANVFFGITTLLLTVNLYLTFSQASWIAMTVVFFMLVWLSRKLPSKQLITRLSILIILSVVLVFSLLQIHTPLSGESIQSANVIQSNAVNNRIDYWKTSWEMFTNYPWTGVGIGNFETIYTHYQQNVWSFSVSPHNNLLLYLSELGIFGLITFLIFLYSIFNKAKKVIRKTAAEDQTLYYYAVGVTGGIIASFGHSLTDIDWEIPALLLLWFIEVGIIFALHRSLFEEKKLINKATSKKSQIMVFASSLVVGYLIIIPTITDLWNKQINNIQSEINVTDDSMALLEKAIALNPFDADLFSNLSENYQIRMLDHKGVRDENLYKSIKYAKKAVELDPLSAERHEALGYALNLASSGEDEEIVEAENEFRKAIAYNPNNNLYQYQLIGFVLQRQKKYDQAIEFLDIALNLFDNESINKIHSDQETHDQLLGQVEAIKNLRETIITQKEE
ncbi:MAG: O-antigen ligase family protein [Patescibacteria group bacterium]|jgi:O-antigen ligase